MRAVKLQRRLKTVGREIRAVKAGLKGLEEAGAVTAAAAVDADPLDKGAAAAEGARQEVAVKPEAPAAPEDGAASAAGSQLQRATMLQRLEALRAKKAQLQVGLFPLDAHVGCSCTVALAGMPYTPRVSVQPGVFAGIPDAACKADAPCEYCVSISLTLWPCISPIELQSLSALAGVNGSPSAELHAYKCWLHHDGCSHQRYSSQPALLHCRRLWRRLRLQQRVLPQGDQVRK